MQRLDPGPENVTDRVTYSDSHFQSLYHTVTTTCKPMTSLIRVRIVRNAFAFQSYVADDVWQMGWREVFQHPPHVYEGMLDLHWDQKSLADCVETLASIEEKAVHLLTDFCKEFEDGRTG